ncbi:MAG: DNA primase [Candidatus Moranbacteria bacterium CG_4_10_14_3_um_filter_44_15]|nr:MAG: DNA primase [Candidatus Moranbacteria bacterium CG06_land_8_20_14_3_00_43_56]PIV83692.1 MAG: DNA primase [Candidatus Moranbacteria bacterium CG17_big_fil_post_rev_8_21_14_2_50_44_12]PIW93388.1 MAG: DNA primase [Candidatus Moranbacteria bacterium CG_4_8_14_3_um_filter_43_15]PIX91185.1 MAG: DNA primase [Candidatus Moranbacteria bacterium CG_4_10_14_3_um_filter_44_15]PJA86351.1 MAG: DNA primase [Candidatus Moranbacteria bacterium CG_4_9_14_3_um_filter_44_28]
MSSDVEEIKNRIDIVDLVGEYIRLTKAGSNWKALCPFHNEKTPSFMVSEERKSFHCFGCSKGGDIFTFVMEMEGIGFREALEQLAQKAGITLKKREARDEKLESSKKKLFEILELATKWYEKNLWEGRGKEKILNYLHERGLNDGTIKKFRLGYAPDGWRNLLEFLLKKNYDIADISKTGILVEKDSAQKIQNTQYEIQDTKYYDRFRDRIMFPIQDIMGRVVGFSARVAPGGDEKTAKYINTSQTELYDKSKILYGLHLAKTEIKKRDEAILVEGNMDVIASHQAGFGNTIAVSGTALAPEQVKTIKRYTENLKIGFDMDVAGQEAAKRSIRICLGSELDVKIILLDGGKDAADVIRENPKLWREAVERAESILDYYFKDAFSRYDAKSPVGKKKIARELLNVIKDVANPVEQAHWIRVLSEKLETGEKVLSEVIRKVKSEKKEAVSPEKQKTAGAGGQSVLTKRMIGIFAAFPKECRREIEKVSISDFQGEKEKKIISAIKEKRENASLEALKAVFPDYETEKFLDEAVFEAEVEFGDLSGLDPAEELKKSLKRLKSENMKRKIVGIAQDIKAAEKSGDRKKVKELMGEFQNLTSMLSQIS